MSRLYRKASGCVPSLRKKQGRWYNMSPISILRKGKQKCGEIKKEALCVSPHSIFRIRILVKNKGDVAGESPHGTLMIMTRYEM